MKQPDMEEIMLVLISFLQNNSDHVYESGTLNLNYSDHQAIFVTKKKNKMKTDKISFTGRSYRNYNAEEFQNTLKKEIWEELYGLDDPNIAWEFLIKKIIKCLDRLCPKKKFNIKKYKENWMNRDIMELIIDKDKALKKAKKSKQLIDFEIANRLKLLVGKMVKNAKISFLENEFENARGDPKQFWKNIYSILPKTKMDRVVRRSSLGL